MFFKGDKKDKFKSKTKRLATVVVSMVTILLIVPMSIARKMIIR
jgi:lipopolysaccharide/colanic/teichoic acid biosynthesis glycosyltransferase